MKTGVKITCKQTGEAFTVTAYTSTWISYSGQGVSGKCLTAELRNLFEVTNGR